MNGAISAFVTLYHTLPSLEIDFRPNAEYTEYTEYTLCSDETHITLSRHHYDFFLKPVRDRDGSAPSVSASFYGSSYCHWGTLEPDSESERNGVITEQIYFLVDSGEKQVQGYQLSFSKVPPRHNR